MDLVFSFELFVIPPLPKIIFLSPLSDSDAWLDKTSLDLFCFSMGKCLKFIQIKGKDLNILFILN